LNTADILILGGGAAGFFTAINAADANPGSRIIILERGKEVLTKVKVSGGGRCNVTHAEFDPKELTMHYPRGEKELLGPFHHFMTGDTIAWFEERGIALKTESDGRMFPESDSSQTIIDCFLSEADRLGISVLRNHSVKSIQKKSEAWLVVTTEGNFTAQKVVVATGSNTKVWKLLENLNHSIVAPVPSLFTFNIKDIRIDGLQGVATPAHISVLGEQHEIILESEGPLLITHWGMSGPAVLKLSAWGARLLAPMNYAFTIQVNWLAGLSFETTLEDLKSLKKSLNKKLVASHAQFELPKRLWQRLV